MDYFQDVAHQVLLVVDVVESDLELLEYWLDEQVEFEAAALRAQEFQQFHLWESQPLLGQELF